MRLYTGKVGKMKLFAKECPWYYLYIRSFVVCIFGVIIFITIINTDTMLSLQEFHNRIVTLKFKEGTGTHPEEHSLKFKEGTRARPEEHSLDRLLTGLPKTQRKPSNCTDEFRNRHLMTVDYTGRTGNHLFRFASLLAISELTCYKPVRNLEHLPMDDMINLQNVEKFNGTDLFRHIGEPGWGIFDSNILNRITPNSNWTLKGFRQSYRYFQNSSEYVRSSFRFKDDITKDVSEFLSQEKFTRMPKVCMHVRRGDLLKTSPQDGRVPAGMEFIKRSIAYMTNYLKQSQFTLIVVSDDKYWCKQHITGENVFISPFKDIGRDLYLLTQCDHNIVTSGTFGWMGAWLNETGVVIYNKMFPIPNSRITRGFKKDDYYPNHWVGI